MGQIISGIARYLSDDVAALDVISQNVANMRTAGYRAERLKPDFRSGVLSGTPTLDDFCVTASAVGGGSFDGATAATSGPGC